MATTVVPKSFNPGGLNLISTVSLFTLSPVSTFQISILSTVYNAT